MSRRMPHGELSIRDPEETVERITRFLRTHYETANVRYLVLGMSGGLDSTVTAVLCAKAIGGNKVLAFSLPEQETRNETNIRLAEHVSEQFNINFRIVDISPIVDTTKAILYKISRKDAKLAKANLKARLRMVLLYYFANLNDGLVVGTSDKSEVMLGYFTKYGDGGCDIEPLADLYKTSVKSLAEYLKLPKTIISKPASPELWKGQTAEEELGAAYDKIDQVLWNLERWIDPKEISESLEIPLALVKRVRERYLLSEHKRRMPLVMKMGFRTAGQDLRLPYSMGI